MPDKILVTVPLPIRTLTPTPTPHPWFYSLILIGFIQTRSIQNVMFTCWQCSQYPSIVATSSTVVSILGLGRPTGTDTVTVAARTPFCVYCSQLSIRRPATKETRPDANSSLSVSLLETSLGVETGTRYWGRRPVASIAHGVTDPVTG